MQGYNTILIFNKDHTKALFCKRLKDPYKGKFNLVGGKIEPGESGFHAAYRELEEETGITPKDVRLSHMMDFTFYNQECYMESYVGQLERDVTLVPEYHPLHWLPLSENFFDTDRFAGEGNIGHIFELVDGYGTGPLHFHPSPDHPVTVLCYGDSNTYGFNPDNGLRYPKQIRWTSLLQNQLGPEYVILNEGCNGRTALAVPPAEPWKSGGSSLECCLNSHKPIDVIILMLGSNDLKSQYALTAEEIAGGVRDLISRSKSFLMEKQGFAPRMILVAPTVLGDKFLTEPDEFDGQSIAQSKDFAKSYAAVAEETGSVFFDASTCIESSPVDSLHLSPQAHQALASCFADIIRGLEL